MALDRTGYKGSLTLEISFSCPSSLLSSVLISFSLSCIVTKGCKCLPAYTTWILLLYKQLEEKVLGLYTILYFLPLLLLSLLPVSSFSIGNHSDMFFVYPFICMHSCKMFIVFLYGCLLNLHKCECYLPNSFLINSVTCMWRSMYVVMPTLVRQLVGYF